MPRVFDAHIHVVPWRMMNSRAQAALLPEADRLRLDPVMEDAGRLLDLMDEWGVERAALVNYVSPDILGFTDEVNEHVLSYCRGNEDRLLPVGGIHPLYEKRAKESMERIIAMGIRAVKVHPPHQMVRANGYLDGVEALRTIYRTCETEGIPVIIHTGTSVFPGARNRFGDPIHVDDVAVDFPDLKIVLAHGGRPLWMETAVFLVRRFPNVYMDISSIPPASLLRYFPRLESIAHKVMFGSDWPGLGVSSVRANADGVLALPLSGEAKERVLWRTASDMFP